ncbi:MAG: hypothetical protein RR768_02725 [Clostridium sp.]
MENKLNLTPELLEKAKSATSAAALLVLAQEGGIDLTAEQAADYYTQLHPKAGALSDEELDNVAGGCGDDSNRKLAIDYVKTNYCGKDLRCCTFQTQNAKEKQDYMEIIEVWGRVCFRCTCKEEINAHCRTMGWTELESVAPLQHIL